MTNKKKERRYKAGAREPERAAIGLEAEFVCLVDGGSVDPSEAFGDPRAFLGADAMHRVGTSYHISTGGAVYFDTGVIELVTPVIELQRSAPSQVVRSLWEGICGVQGGIDEWAGGEGRTASLAGFSTHYNVSLPNLGDRARMDAIGWLLVHMLPFPVMLFAANRRSTGVGVRPRPGRIEVTVDFTPDAALTGATAAIVAAAVVEVSGWSTHDLHELRRRHYPVLDTLRPVPHTSRRGWLVRSPSFEADPFATPPDLPRWRLADGRRASLRGIARGCIERLMPSLRSVAAPETVAFIRRVLARRHPSLLDLEDRPAAYEDVGHVCLWNEPDGRRPLPRSLYEQVMRDAIRRRPLLVQGRRWVPVATRGWTRVLYQRDDGRRRVFTVDELVRLGATR